MCYRWCTKQTELKKGAGGELLGGNLYDIIHTFPLFGEKCQLSAVKVNYDWLYRPYWKVNKTTFYAEKMAGGNYDRPLEIYDLPFIGYIRRKNDMVRKAKYNWPLVNYDRFFLNLPSFNFAL